MTRLFLAALLALLPAPYAAAQVRGGAAVPAILSAPAAVAPLGASALVPSLSAASVAPLPAAALPLASVLPAPAAWAPVPGLPAAASSAPESSRPAVLRSLEDLHLFFQGPAGPNAGAFYDGARDSGKPQVLVGVPGVAVKPVRGGLSEFQPHEVATIRKIQVLASDLKILVRESGATPDLVVNGVVTELKTVHRGKLSRQLTHANGQLVAHAKRHGLSLGAVVLDVLGQPVTSRRVEEEIARVVREEPEIGFARVYVFHGGAVKTYSPAADGTFRLDAAARPFAPLSGPAVAGR